MASSPDHSAPASTVEQEDAAVTAPESAGAKPKKVKKAATPAAAVPTQEEPATKSAEPNPAPAKKGKKKAPAAKSMTAAKPEAAAEAAERPAKPKSKSSSATKSTVAIKLPTSAAAHASVDVFLEELEHPRKREIQVVRRWILGIDPDITEAVKWNAPSFRTKEYFATFNLNSEDSVQLVFHLGAKVRDGSRDITIVDRVGMIRWLAADRCLITLGAGEAILSKRSALEDFIREWLGYL